MTSRRSWGGVGRRSLRFAWGVGSRGKGLAFFETHLLGFFEDLQAYVGLYLLQERLRDPDSAQLEGVLYANQAGIPRFYAGAHGQAAAIAISSWNEHGVLPGPVVRCEGVM